MTKRWWTGLLIATLLNGCATEREATLYPANDVARTQGVLTAIFEAHGTGHGIVAIVLPSGERLGGEFSIIRGGAVGFGGIFGAVYGPNYVMSGTGQGTASAFGSGVSMECEFVNDNLFGHGYGACRSSKGALYRLQY